MLKKFILPAWVAGALLLLLYSFTQVDLSLTLSQVSIWQHIQKAFQYIGYFNRPLSASFFVLIILLLFALYLITLRLAYSGMLKKHALWKIIIAVSLILFFSYNAFSYDLFNYIFDAKIVTFYHQNPYLHKALDFPGDPMLSFMHWTHRVYPYGPTWLAVTIPLSFIGFGYFLLTFYCFKLLALFTFLGCAFLIDKISKKKTYALAFFALNPLVLTESLVSAHNDTFMVLFALLAIYYLFQEKKVKSVFSLLLSVGVKFATVFLIPSFIFHIFFKKRDIDNQIFFLSIGIVMIFAVILASLRTNFQPWYLLFVIPFLSFIAQKYFILIPVIIFSLFSLFQYLPFLYLGNWDSPVPEMLLGLNISSIVLSIVFVLLYKVQKKYKIVKLG